MYTKDNYNEEPVHYCTNCLSLNTKILSNSSLVACGECGNTSIEETDINTWTELFNKEYGRYFLSSEETNLAE